MKLHFHAHIFAIKFKINQCDFPILIRKTQTQQRKKQQ
jgi:hypothetical protein